MGCFSKLKWRDIPYTSYSYSYNKHTASVVYHSCIDNNNITEIIILAKLYRRKRMKKKVCYCLGEYFYACLS